MNNVLYVIPDIYKVSGGPRTRISMFKNVFEKNGDNVVMLNNKAAQCLKLQKPKIVYVESATNRISLIDFICLCYLRIVSKEMIIFIRDIYIELFPEEYTGFRKRLTKNFNIISNFFLTLIASKLVFPTKEMGDFFFKTHKRYPKRQYTALPPGCVEPIEDLALPEFSKKLGILYLGGVSYANSGFVNFLNLADNNQKEYNFFVLSGDPKAKELIKGRNHVTLSSVSHKQIPHYINANNILVAFHTRPKNLYDDLTFPIKVLDFIGFKIPFVTDYHKPLINLLGESYPLFSEVSNYRKIIEQIKQLSNKKEFKEVTDYLGEIAEKNSYDIRYEQILTT